MSPYDKMILISNQLRNIERSLSLLAWDERTYMPEGALPGRSEMNAGLAKIHHNILTSREMKKCLDKLNKPSIYEDLDDLRKASVKEITRRFEKKNNIPDEIVEKIAKAASQGQAAWTKARARSDFAMFIPYLEKNLELKKKAAEYMGYKNEPYDALLDEYEPELTAKGVKKVFDPMKKGLSDLVDEISSRGSSKYDKYNINKTFNTDTQKELCRRMARDIGFDFHSGRLDESVHPFTVGMDFDVRITNRYNEKDLSSLYSLLHESGHGMYEQGICKDLLGTPIGKSASMGYHESQSRMWENFVGRNRNFMDYLYPLVVEYFPSMEKVGIDDFYRSVNCVEPSYIRVEADEITYNLHIALRFDIELGLMRDEITPAETETVWQDNMEEYLGLIPEDPALGVLQDIHWSSGAFGYFPSYALGNLYAAQIFNTIVDEIPSLFDHLSKGEFTPLLNWLRDNIHSNGRRYLPEEMTKRLTGKSLDFKYFHQYVKEKYGDIYDL